MSLLGVAGRAQRFAESLMVDSCTITRPGATPTASVVTVYTGKCRIRMTPRMPEQMPQTAGTTASRYILEVHIPATTTGVEHNDKVTITASANPSLVDTSTYVTGLMGQTAGSAQRLWCEKALR